MVDSDMTTAEVLAAIARERGRLEAALAALGDGVATTPVTPDGWTAKDELAHMIHWVGQIAWGMGASLQPPAYVTSAAGRRPSADEWNAMAAEHYGALSYPEVRTEFDRVVDALVAATGQRSDAEMAATDAIPWGGGRPLWEQIGGETFNHWPEHIADLEAAAVRSQ